MGKSIAQGDTVNFLFNHIHSYILCNSNTQEGTVLLVTTHFCLHHCTGMEILDEDLQNVDMTLLSSIVHWRPSILDSISRDRNIP